MKQPHPWRTRRSRTLFWDPCLSRIAFWQFVGISCLVVTSAWVSMSLGLPSQASAFSPPLGLVFGFLLIHASARRLPTPAEAAGGFCSLHPRWPAAAHRLAVAALAIRAEPLPPKHPHRDARATRPSVGARQTGTRPRPAAPPTFVFFKLAALPRWYAPTETPYSFHPRPRSRNLR